LAAISPKTDKPDSVLNGDTLSMVLIVTSALVLTMYLYAAELSSQNSALPALSRIIGFADGVLPVWSV